MTAKLNLPAGWKEWDAGVVNEPPPDIELDDNVAIYRVCDVAGGHSFSDAEQEYAHAQTRASGMWWNRRVDGAGEPLAGCIVAYKNLTIRFLDYTTGNDMIDAILEAKNGNKSD